MRDRSAAAVAQPVIGDRLCLPRRTVRNGSAVHRQRHRTNRFWRIPNRPGTDAVPPAGLVLSGQIPNLIIPRLRIFVLVVRAAPQSPPRKPRARAREVPLLDRHWPCTAVPARMAPARKTATGKDRRSLMAPNTGLLSKPVGRAGDHDASDSQPSGTPSRTSRVSEYGNGRAPTIRDLR